MNGKTNKSFCPAGRKQWRRWLEKNHASEKSVWLIYYKKHASVPTITYNEAVEEALCFGWIDSTKKTIDEDRFQQYFCKRKPDSVWSKINKAKVKRLIESGQMMPAGYQSISKAKQNGFWTILNDVENLVIPKDLDFALSNFPGAGKFFLSLNNSTRKAILQWLVLARKPETRLRRIREIAELASRKMKPKQF
ncbi:MAG: hypothetical protein EYC69_12385 [Bacteroidetes bacterium]|nr:MAG: hypothetical protein EYC69_12385 [Bacteroidota bacterium]